VPHTYTANSWYRVIARKAGYTDSAYSTVYNLSV
jgi:hypothetical protein